MDFVKYFSDEHPVVSKSRDDVSDVFRVNIARYINYGNCFEFRPNKDIICLNRKKIDKVFDILSKFGEFDFLNKFKTAYGINLINLINDIIKQKIVIPEYCMCDFIIYLILTKHNYSFDEEFIKLFEFIHIERYFDVIQYKLPVISLAEYTILFTSNRNMTYNKYFLPLYLLNKGDRLLYNPSKFNQSCLYKALVSNNFELAYMLITRHCNLYENEESFKDSALFYAMFFRNRTGNMNGINEISEQQWSIITMILNRCKKFNYHIDPEQLIISINAVYNGEHSDIDVIEFEKFLSNTGNPISYALSGYPHDKLEYIIRAHPELLEQLKEYEDLYKILIERYFSFYSGMLHEKNMTF